MDNKKIKTITYLSIILVFALLVASFAGAFISKTYARDTESLAAQGIGQDIVNLFIVIPLLLLSLIMIRKKHKIFYFIFGGTILYIFYSFIIYCFGVRFNNLFLIYCLILGVSFYTLAIFIYGFNQIGVEYWFDDKTPIRSTSILLIIISIMFYFTWLSDIIPAILNKTVPKSVSDLNLLVNPVHVLDIAITLPGLIISSLLLLNKHRLGYILAPICLVFCVILTIALVGMIVSLKMKGINEDMSIAVIFIVISLVSFIILYRFSKTIIGEKLAN